MNEQEFAEKHNLNGSECVAVVQEVVINDDLTTETAAAAKYTDAMYGSGCIINVRKSDLPYIPETGIRSGWTENTVKWYSAKTMKVY